MNFIERLKNNSLIQPEFIPTSKNESDRIGWDEIDILLITGDAYVDHPSFGTAIIGRVLIAAGYRVGIIAQPDWKDTEALKALGKPLIACAVSSGNLDSMLNLYTAGRRLRKNDAYSPGDKINNRPPRALTVYANLVRSAFPGVPVIIGGIEASMRRIAHYDYWKDQIMPSILVNTKADLLIYGMAEKSIIETIDKIKENKDLSQIKSTARLLGKKASYEFLTNSNINHLELPSFKEILSKDGSLLRSHQILENEINPFFGKPLIQRYDERILLLEPPALPLTTEEMDFIYSLPYAKTPHPKYKEKIPAYEMIKDSIASIRGCPGGCSFCGLGLHQGKFLTCRSKKSILEEINHLTKNKTFRGTISDIGGPTANAYSNKPKNIDLCHKCRRPSCLFPAICPNYSVTENELLELLKEVSSINKVKHVFINSGFRLDLAKYQKKLVLEVIKKHVSGHLKVAPEHLDLKVLKLMRKNSADDFYSFVELFYSESKKIHKKQFLVPYFISNFPGSDKNAATIIDKFLAKNHWSLQQVQDFIPLPMTIASAMYHEEMDYNGNPIKVSKGLQERRHQLNILKRKRL